MKSIFVQISSYHDYELPYTIYDALAKSSHEYHINFGIHHIYHKTDDIKIPKIPNVRYEISKAPNNLGMGLGRHIAHDFYDGEDYYFQIDSHMRFDENWDKNLIDDVNKYHAMGIDKPLITNYPRNYWYEDGFERPDSGGFISQISFFQQPDLFKSNRYTSQTAVANIEGNIFSNSVSGGSIFTIGDFIKPNKKIFSNGEETVIAARAYTNGFDLLVPSKLNVYHLYHDPKKDNRRRLAWNDYVEICNSLSNESKSEIYSMFTEKTQGEYHLGSVRSLEEYGTFCGLDFSTGEIIEKC